MIKLKGLNKYFNRGKQNEIHVINNVDLTLPEKGMVAIFGQSGCGKTTLLNVIGGLDGFYSGEIEIDGQNIKSQTDVLRNKYIGYVFQNYNLNKELNCYDNVADAVRLCGITDENTVKQRVNAALSNVDMDKYQNRTPDTLSGGQQQRIAIARAIVKNPKIILADEPTGNLDEINTVMIMDLLKKISEDHLVILVTHEANLVDYYCDTVIELHDGKVVNIKNNQGANGYIARDKNHIYLGELERQDILHNNAKIEYYGDAPTEPIELKIVNSGGKTYIEISTPGITVLDKSSEIKLKEGVYEQKSPLKEKDNNKFDIDSLPTIEGKKHGTLFSFISSVKSGYLTNFKSLNKKRGKRALRRCLVMFAVSLVFITTVLGGVFGDIINSKSAYNHNVFYLYTPNDYVSNTLKEALNDSKSGIDYYRLHYSYGFGDEEAYCSIGVFESFKLSSYGEALNGNGVLLPHSLANQSELVAGQKDNLGENDVIITTAVADKFIEKSNVGYIKDYRDLIGLTQISGYNNLINRIAGVVRSNETAIYISEINLAKAVLENKDYFVKLDSEMGTTLEKGETILVISQYEENHDELPKKGDSISIGGMELNIINIIQAYSDYEGWLLQNNIQLKNEVEFFTDLVKQTHPYIDPSQEEFVKLYDRAYTDNWFDYLEYRYSHYPDFLNSTKMFSNNFYTWLYLEKGVTDALYANDLYFYKAVKYKEMTGTYPTQNNYDQVTSDIEDLESVLKKYQIAFEEEFYQNGFEEFYNSSYVLSKDDYITLSKQVGTTHKSAKINYQDEYNYYDSVWGGFDTKEYTLIHSTDPVKTEKWLYENFSHLDTGDERLSAIITPDDVFNEIIEFTKEGMMISLITMGIILLIMSVCMYFIMRSSLMVRIKEIGIYRAIGVSKKNLVFKFAIESIVLTTLTVFIGYLMSSAFIYVCHYISPLSKSILYYPPWLSLSLLILLYGICVFCGILPIVTLLRKTPSEILAKYDI